MFKGFLDTKVSVNKALEIQVSADKLRVDVSEEISYLNQLISVI